MRAVVQCVTRASVKVDGDCVASIDKGLLVFLGIATDDTLDDAQYLIRKILNLRIFFGDERHMNKCVRDVDGQVLLVSQFTLYADCSKGNRPSFSKAMPPALALPMYNEFVSLFQQQHAKTCSGIFGAMMEVELVNDGPLTIILDSR